MNARWSPFIKQVAIIGLLIISAWLLVRARVLLTPLVLSLLLAYLLSFPVHWIVRHTGWPRTMVVLVTYLLTIVLVIVAPVLIVPRLVSLFASLGGTLFNIAEELAGATPTPIKILPGLTVSLGEYYAPVSDWLRSVIAPDVTTLDKLQAFLFPFASGAAFVVRSAVTSVLWAVFILATSFYVVKDGPSMGRWIAARLPDTLRAEVERLAKDLAAVWDAFVRGQFTMAVMVGLIVWVITMILGVRNSPALGLLSGVAEFVPGVGPAIAGMVGTLIALIFGSSWLPIPNLWFAALLGLLYILLSQFESVYLAPRVVGRRISLHPIVVIVGAVAGAEMVGVLGILLAAPVIASLRVMFGYVVRKLLDEEPFPPLQPLPDRSVLWASLAAERAPCAIVFDLDGTLVEADDSAIEGLAGALKFLRRVFPNADLIRLARQLFLISNFLTNQFVSIVGMLRLNQVLYRYNDRLRGLRGVCPPEAFVAVPGSTEMLHWLGRRYRLGIVTSRPREEAFSFLNQYGLASLFRSVITRDDVRRLKPDPVPMRLVARQLGAEPEQCVMVGDTGMDVRAAKAAGMLAIGVLSGFGQERDFCDADLVISSTAQLGAWL